MAVEARPFSRSADNNFSSMESMALRSFCPSQCSEYTLKMPRTTLPFAMPSGKNGDPNGGGMKDIVIVGAGKIGSMIAEFLGSSGDYAVTVADRSQAQLDRLEPSVPIKKAAIDIAQGDALRTLLSGKFAVLSAAPYHATRLIAEAAKSGGAHYLDLTED